MTDEIQPDPRVAVVLITHNRCDQALDTLSHLQAMPEAPRTVVVDNASADGTAARVRERFPRVEVIDAGGNLGAAARNIGVLRVDTPYVAFSDDDTRWVPGSLARAADLFDARPRLALVAARVLVGADGVEDPTCRVMAESGLPLEEGMPGPPVLGFLAGATVVRRSAFLKAGGFEPRFFIGGEEELLAADIAAQGDWLCYVPDLVVYHYPSPRRDHAGRSRIQVRNALWFAWLRRPPAVAVRKTLDLLRGQPSVSFATKTFADAARGLPWVLRRRRVVPHDVERSYRLLEARA
jgi:GT2 family glycosyltransferase